MKIKNEVVYANYKTIKAEFSTIYGNNNTVTGDSNKIVGNNNEIKGDCNSIMGNNNKINGDCNSIVGNNNNMKGDCNTIVGNKNNSKGDCNTKKDKNNNYLYEDNKIIKQPHKNKTVFVSNGNKFSSMGNNNQTNFFNNGRIMNQFVNGIQTIKDGIEIKNCEIPNDLEITTNNQFNIDSFFNNNLIQIGSNNDRIIDLTDKEEKKDEEIKVPDEEKEEDIKEEDKISEELICKICESKKVNTVVLNCGHSRMCISCSREWVIKQKNKKCPFCREDIKKIIKKF